MDPVMIGGDQNRLGFVGGIFNLFAYVAQDTIRMLTTVCR